MSFSNTNQAGQSGQTALTHPDTVRAFRTVQQLVIAYVVLSVVTVVVIFALKNDHSLVNKAAVSRGIGVVISAAVTLLVARRAAAGSRGAFRRLRFGAPIVAAVIVVLVATAGYPAWMDIEQLVCALLLAGVAVLANGQHLRTLFAEL